MCEHEEFHAIIPHAQIVDEFRQAARDEECGMRGAWCMVRPTGMLRNVACYVFRLIVG